MSETKNALIDVAGLLRREWVAQGNSLDDLPPSPPSPPKSPAWLTWGAGLAFVAGVVVSAILVARSAWFPLNGQSAETARAVAEVKKELSQLDQKISDTERSVTSTRTALNGATKDLRKLETDLEGTNRQFENVLASINKLGRDLRNARAVMSTKRDLEKARAELEEKHDTAAARIKSIQTSLATVEAEVARLKKDVGKLLARPPKAPADEDADYSGTREGAITFPGGSRGSSRDMVAINDRKTKTKHVYPVRMDATWMDLTKKEKVEPRAVGSGSLARLTIKEGKVTKVEVMKRAVPRE